MPIQPEDEIRGHAIIVQLADKICDLMSSAGDGFEFWVSCLDGHRPNSPARAPSEYFWRLAIHERQTDPPEARDEVPFRFFGYDVQVLDILNLLDPSTQDPDPDRGVAFQCADEYRENPALSITGNYQGLYVEIELYARPRAAPRGAARGVRS